MKKRQLKKWISQLSDYDLYEYMAYADGKRLRVLIEKEFDKRFKETLQFEKNMAEELMHISNEADEILMR